MDEVFLNGDVHVQRHRVTKIFDIICNIIIQWYGEEREERVLRGEDEAQRQRRERSTRSQVSVLT